MLTEEGKNLWLQGTHMKKREVNIKNLSGPSTAVYTFQRECRDSEVHQNEASPHWASV